MTVMQIQRETFNPADGRGKSGLRRLRPGIKSSLSPQGQTSRRKPEDFDSTLLMTEPARYGERLRRSLIGLAVVVDDLSQSPPWSRPCASFQYSRITIPMGTTCGGSLGRDERVS